MPCSAAHSWGSPLLLGEVAGGGTAPPPSGELGGPAQRTAFPGLACCLAVLGRAEAARRGYQGDAAEMGQLWPARPPSQGRASMAPRRWEGEDELIIQGSP